VQRRVLRPALERPAEQRLCRGRVAAAQAQLRCRGQRLGRTRPALGGLLESGRGFVGFSGRGERAPELQGVARAARGVDRLRRVAQAKPRRAQHRPSRVVCLINFNSLLSNVGRVARVADIELRLRERGELGRAAEVEALARQRAQRLHYPQHQLALQGAARFGEQAQLAAHGAEIGVRHDVVRSQAQRLAVALARGFELAPGVARGAEVVPGFGEGRVQTQRAPIGRERLVQPAAVLQHVAEIVVVRGHCAVALDRAPEQRFRGGERAAAQVDHAENVQRVGFVPVFPDQRLGGVELASREVMPRAQDLFEHRLFEHRASIVSEAPPC
jgi:hypothetical protein